MAACLKCAGTNSLITAGGVEIDEGTKAKALTLSPAGLIDFLSAL